MWSVAGFSMSSSVRVSKEEGDCIVCLEMRADELMRHLISGELTNYRVVRTSPEPLHLQLCVDYRITSQRLRRGSAGIFLE
jgi:hypothetical protein